MLTAYELAHELAFKLYDPVVFRKVKRVVQHIEENAPRLGLTADTENTMVVTALLHRILEETPMTKAILRRLFQEEIADAVLALTRHTRGAGDTAFAKYRIKRATLNPIARVVKIAELENLAQDSTLLRSLKPHCLEALDTLKQPPPSVRDPAARRTRIMTHDPRGEN